MADPISLDGMSSDERQELKEALCDAVLERTRRVAARKTHITSARGAPLLSAATAGRTPSAWQIAKLSSARFNV